MAGDGSRVPVNVFRPWIAAALLTLSSAAAAATPLASVEALQPPVWLERGGQRTALATGQAVQQGDRFITGAGGRLHLALADLSVVKLGENARLDLPRLAFKPVPDSTESLFSSTLSVVKGALRYTTRELGKLRPREVDLAIGPTLTAGIRGTDVWGNADSQKDLICLLEGQIDVSSGEAARLRMDQPGTFYVVPQGLAALPVAPVLAEKLASWIPQTELRSDDATLTARGSYMVGLQSSTDADSAQAAVRTFAELGYATEIVRARVGGKTWYRVVISGLEDHAQAQRFAARLKQTLGLQSPWVMPPPNL